MQKTIWWARFDIWFVFLTALYFLLNALGLGPKIDCLDVCTYPAFPHGIWFVDLIGLFVPVGPNNGILLLVFGSILLDEKIIIFFVGGFLLLIAYIIEKNLNFFEIRPALKIPLNLAVLMGFTFLLDMALFQNWVSFELFKKSLGF